MLIIICILLFLILYIYSLIDIVYLLYYNDIFYKIEEISKKCYENENKTHEEIKFSQENDYIYKYNDIILNMLKKCDDIDCQKKYYINIFAKKFHNLIYENNILEKYNALSGTLLGLFVVFLVCIFIIYNKKRKFFMLYLKIILFIITYIVLFSLLSDKLKNFFEKIEKSSYTIHNINYLKNDIEEIKRILYFHIILIFIIIIIIIFLYKSLYGEYNTYIIYILSIIIFMIIYGIYYSYNIFYRTNY